MEPDERRLLVDAIEALRAEVAEVKGLLRDLVGATASVDASTKESATKIVAAIQRWT